MRFESIPELEASGFHGFSSIADLRRDKLQHVPREPGVYLVVRAAAEPPEFLARSSAGRRKGRDPSVARECLESRWVAGVLVVYIGKAGSALGKATLRGRLGQYLRSGLGPSNNHWGGRLIWQLGGAEALLLCWKAVPSPRATEADLIQEFVAAHGKKPFANLVR